MLEDLDKKTKLDIIITIIATFISINFIIFSYVFKENATQILSILVILLPMIYIVGNLIIRGILEKESKDLRDGYEETIAEIYDGVEEMKDEIDKLREENKILKNKRER